MRFLKKNVILRLMNSYLVDSPQPSNISYAWNFGSLLGLCLIIQILTGVFLAMHYQPHVDFAFSSVEHIMRDVQGGWLLRYTHANVASFFFICTYAHIARGLYYGSYRAPRTLVWNIGVIILILMMAIAFLGYVLPYGQMSLWGATVITNLLSAIPIFGKDFVELIWGGFSVSNATLNRFFALHFLLPFVLVGLVLGHFLALHEHGSGNPNGISSNADRYAMHPYFTFKDLVTVFFFFLCLAIVVCFYPNALGHSDNYISANPMQTPPSIVPEWYLLPYYAILRSIPNKLLGVLAMFGSLLILLSLPYTDLSRVRTSQFRPVMKIVNSIFLCNFLILMFIGSQHPESPFVEIGQISTAIYFAYFLCVPLLGILENTLADLGLSYPNRCMVAKEMATHESTVAKTDLHVLIPNSSPLASVTLMRSMNFLTENVTNRLRQKFMVSYSYLTVLMPNHIFKILLVLKLIQVLISVTCLFINIYIFQVYSYDLDFLFSYMNEEVNDQNRTVFDKELYLWILLEFSPDTMPESKVEGYTRIEWANYPTDDIVNMFDEYIYMANLDVSELSEQEDLNIPDLIPAEAQDLIPEVSQDSVPEVSQDLGLTEATPSNTNTVPSRPPRPNIDLNFDEYDWDRMERDGVFSRYWDVQTNSPSSTSGNVTPLTTPDLTPDVSLEHRNSSEPNTP